MKAIKEIFAPYEREGRSSIILTGRNIYDLECGDDGKITTIEKMMEEYALRLHLVVVRYILAKGILVPYHRYGKRDAETVRRVLANYEIINPQRNLEKCSASQDLVRILNGISQMATATNADIKWQDGECMKFMFMFEFASDIIPPTTNDNQRAAREFIYQLVSSYPFQSKGNLLVISDVVEGKIDNQIQDLIYHKFLPYPNYEEKLEFVKGLHRIYPRASYAEGLDDRVIANLSSSTPNRGLDMVFNTSHKTGAPIEAKGLVEQKMTDVQNISENTIAMLDTARVTNVSLKGENIRVAQEFLKKISDGLLHHDKINFSSNILLMGAPGTAKTDLALCTALHSGLPIFQLNSPKKGIVGETERLAALQTRIFSSTKPSIGFIDEITESFPMQRTHNLDSGASAAVMQAMLSSLSDNSRENLLIATTNCGYKMGSAMRDRFVVVPVIMPAEEDFSAILCSIAEQVSGCIFDERNNDILAAAKIFYDKHVMPRRIRAALKLELVFQRGRLAEKAILAAAKGANPLDEASWLSAIYADLCAISLTVSQRLLPWYGREDSYPFPDYIRSILDENYQVDPVKLNNELKRLQPYVNV
ncbi:MAG: AAA family ATPase [Bacteroidales bacterium]|nr:AAA family ATPase [Bacteroidales bacterium]